MSNKALKCGIRNELSFSPVVTICKDVKNQYRTWLGRNAEPIQQRNFLSRVVKPSRKGCRIPSPCFSKWDLRRIRHTPIIPTCAFAFSPDCSCDGNNYFRNEPSTKIPFEKNPMSNASEGIGIMGMSVMAGRDHTIRKQPTLLTRGGQIPTPAPSYIDIACGIRLYHCSSWGPEGKSWSRASLYILFHGAIMDQVPLSSSSIPHTSWHDFGGIITRTDNGEPTFGLRQERARCNTRYFLYHKLANSVSNFSWSSETWVKCHALPAQMPKCNS